MLSKKNIKTILSIGLALLLSACNKRTLVSDELMVFTNDRSDKNPVVEDSLNKGHYYNHLDTNNRYSKVYYYKLKEEDYDKVLMLVVTAKVRTNSVYSNACISYNTSGDSSGYTWDANNIKYSITDLNTWCYLHDEATMVKSNKHNPYNKIAVQSVLFGHYDERVDIDSVRVKVYRYN